MPLQRHKAFQQPACTVTSCHLVHEKNTTTYNHTSQNDIQILFFALFGADEPSFYMNKEPLGSEAEATSTSQSIPTRRQMQKHANVDHRIPRLPASVLHCVSIEWKRQELEPPLLQLESGHQKCIPEILPTEGARSWGDKQQNHMENRQTIEDRGTSV